MINTSQPVAPMLKAVLSSGKDQKVLKIIILKSSLLLKPTPNLDPLVNWCNNATLENNNDPENISSSKYYVDGMHNVEVPNKNKSLSLFDINACSLNKSFDHLQHLVSCTKIILT